MANWKDRWEQKDRYGNEVVDVWERNGELLAYRFKSDYENGKCYITDRVQHLMPIKKYRAFTEQELSEKIKSVGGALWLKSKRGERKILVTHQDPNYWFDYYLFLDGKPVGVEINNG